MAGIHDAASTERRDLEDAPFDDLLTEVLAQVKDARDEQVRWRLLLEAVVTMAARLTLDELITRIVAIAGHLVDAQYAALGVLGSGSERRLRHFVTVGLTGAEMHRIGDLPTGHGVLGLLIDHPEPVRLHDITEHPRSVGFPAEHPPMHGFLGVPVRARDKIFGNLYLTDKRGGTDFTSQDEEIVVALAAAAGVAIENALLHEQAERRARWLSARAEITAALMSQSDDRSALQLVADRTREVAAADLTWIATGREIGNLRVQVASGLTLDAAAVAQVSSDDMATALGVDGPVLILPLGIAGAGEEAGVLGMAWRTENAERSEEIDVVVANAFAEQVTIAIRLDRNREDHERLAVYGDRERIGRDLHDVVIQRLFAIGLHLQRTIKATNETDIAARLDQVVDDVDQTIRDIRQSIFELKSDQQSDDPLTRLTTVVDRAAELLGFRPSVRFSGPLRRGVRSDVVDDAVAVLAETLSNVVRHAAATQVGVTVAAAGELRIEVLDNGCGVPTTAVESGLSNIRRRAADRGGHCAIAPGDPSGTLVTWSVPLR